MNARFDAGSGSTTIARITTVQSYAVASRNQPGDVLESTLERRANRVDDSDPQTGFGPSHFKTYAAAIHRGRTISALPSGALSVALTSGARSAWTPTPASR